MTGPTPAETVHRYLAAVAAHDVQAVLSTVSPEVVRVGPFGDVVSGRDAYGEFLASVLAKLPGHRLVVHRVLAAEGSRSVLAEISEHVDLEGAPPETPEAMVFDLGEDGLIARIAIYIQRPSEAPPPL